MALLDTPQTFLHGDWKYGNLGYGRDGRVILLDWAYPGEGPVAHELAWYLALNRARLPVGHSKESTIDDLRSALERRGVDDGLVGAPGRPLLGAVVQFGWEKALGDDDELAWWVDRAARAWRSCERRRTLADAYTATGGAWQAGPGRIYDQLSEVLVDHCPGGVAGRACSISAPVPEPRAGRPSRPALEPPSPSTSPSGCCGTNDPSATGRGR